MKFVTAVFLILYAFCEFQLASEAISIHVPTKAPPASNRGTCRAPGVGAPGSFPGARGPQNPGRLAFGPREAPGQGRSPSRGPPNPQQRPGDAQDIERKRQAQARADRILQEALSSDESSVCIYPPPKNSQRYLFPGQMTIL